MTFIMLRTLLIAAFAGFLVGAGHAAADEVKAILTPGKGDLTMCPERWVYRSCNLYHHVKLPSHVEVGGKVILHYGSNPKRYDFPIARIVIDGGSCTVFSQTGDTENVEKIDVTPCQVAAGPP
jgi:hypothetical protein